MNFLEKDLEEIIFNADKKMLEERGLQLQGKLLRQKRIGNYGLADLIEITKPFYHPIYEQKIKGLINVIELKKERVSVSSFFQALSYVKGIQSFLEKHKPDFENHFNYKITLIGRTLDCESSLAYMPEFCHTDFYEDFVGMENKLNVQIFTYKFDINGLSFNEEYGYALTNEGF